MGRRVFPVLGWAERGDGTATGHGNSVPRSHITWGTGPGLVEPFEARVRSAVERGLVTFKFRHRVDELTRTGGVVDGVRGKVLEPSSIERGQASSRTETGDFELRAQAVIVTSGGIGGNHDLVRNACPDRLGKPPRTMVGGVPAHRLGRLLTITEDSGGNVINPDRMWHYTEGLRNWNPIWDNHGIRILPGPSSLWIDALGNRLPAPYFPGFDTLGTLKHLRATGHDYSWFVLTRSIIDKECALSGSEQNPDMTGKSVRGVIDRARKGPGPVHAFMEHGEDFVVADSLTELVAGMNRLADAEPVGPKLDQAALREVIECRDREIANSYTKDAQLTAVYAARHYRGD